MRFSVIVPVFQSASTLPFCIQGLLQQRFKDFEALFVDSSPDESCVKIIERHPELKLIRSKNRLWMHEAKNVGVRHATGDILVFIDPDCVADPDWLEQLDRSFDEGHLVVGGPVICYSEDLLSQAANLIKFWMWLEEDISKYFDKPPYNHLPTANMSIKRDCFIEFNNSHICGDTLFSYQLQDRDLHLYYNHRVRVRHIHVLTLPSELMHERYARGKDFASMRSQRPDWWRGDSWLFLLLFWALAFRSVYWKYTAARRAGLSAVFLRSFPLILACEFAWMMGQARNLWKHALGFPPERSIGKTSL